LGSTAERFQGIASVTIGGSTLHSWAGIGLGKGPVEKLKWKVVTKDDACKRWKDTAVLVIDESMLPQLTMNTGNLITITVSMVDGGFLDKLEAIARFVREDDRPFGGIQLILCGTRSKYCWSKLTIRRRLLSASPCPGFCQRGKIADYLCVRLANMVNLYRRGD
jgi:hypothetical protein